MYSDSSHHRVSRENVCGVGCEREREREKERERERERERKIERGKEGERKRRRERGGERKREGREGERERNKECVEIKRPFWVGNPCTFNIRYSLRDFYYCHSAFGWCFF
jgi:hypothetical protein